MHSRRVPKQEMARQVSASMSSRSVHSTVGRPPLRPLPYPPMFRSKLGFSEINCPNASPSLK